MRAVARQSGLVARVEGWLPAGYLVVALFITGMLSVMTAPFATPDEEHHAARAIALSHGEWLARAGLGEFGAGEFGAEIDANALSVMDGMDRVRMEWEKGAGDFHNRRHGAVAEALQLQYAGVRWAGRVAFAPFPNTAVNPPLLYLPAVVGWRLGEAAGLTIFESLRLARLLCAWTAVGLGWLAMRLCPGGTRWALVGFLLLPSALFLNASCSQDAALLSVAALVVAMLMRALVEGREFTGEELVVVGGLLAVCGMARPPYLAMAVLVFLPGVELGGGTWRRWIGPLVAFGAVGLVGVWWRGMVASVGFDPADWADPERQMGFLRAHAIAGGWAVVQGTLAGGVDFVRRGLYVVGWNDLPAGRGVAVALAVCLGATIVFGVRSPVRTWAGRAVIAVGVGGSLLGVSLAEYVIWTPPGGNVVYGVQPRYWLPLMPLGMILLRSLLDGVGWGELRGRGWALVGATGVLGAMGCTLPWMVADAFYRESVIRVLQLNLR